MIKSLEIIRPADFPYRLIYFDFFFNTINSHILNIHHAAGMNFVYEQMKICYVFPQNEFYQLLRLQNTEEPHIQKYNWILMKGIFAGEPAIKADIQIENEEILDLLQQDNHLDKKHLYLYRLPERENDIVISEEMSTTVFHHFICNEAFISAPDSFPFINMIYLNSYNNLYHLLNLWFNEENKLMALS
jgi:hypothetical protein